MRGYDEAMRSRFAYACAFALVAVVASGCRSRTQLMFGVITDLRAPDALDEVEMVVQRSGVEVLRVPWTLPGVPGQPYILPGSYGVYTEDGSEPQIAVTLTGKLNGRARVERKALVSLVREKTLFLRLGLVAGCVDRDDCGADETCVESVCKPILVDSRRLPAYVENMEKFVDCASGTTYVDTGTHAPVPTREGMGSCTTPGSTCEEATCYLPVLDETPDLASADLTPPADLAPALFSVEEVPPSAVNRRISAVVDDGFTDRVVAVGENGLVMERTYFAGPMSATAWVDQSAGLTDGGVGPDFRAVAFMPESSDLWLAGAGTLVRREGGVYETLTLPRATIVIESIAIDRGHAWFVGRDTAKPAGMNAAVLHWDGAMLLEDLSVGERPALRSVSLLDFRTGTLIAAGDAGTILVRASGATWTSAASRFPATGTFDYTALASDHQGTVAVGTSDGRVLVLVPGAATATVEPRFSSAVAALWLGAASRRIYAASVDGRIDSRSIVGTTWTTEPDIAPRALRSLVVVSDGMQSARVVAVGDQGLVWSAPATREVIAPNPPPNTDAAAPNCFPTAVGDFCSFDCECPAPATCRPRSMSGSGFSNCCQARGSARLGEACLTSCDCDEGDCLRGSCSTPS
jgi:hypothetical protein